MSLESAAEWATIISAAVGIAAAWVAIVQARSAASDRQAAERAVADVIARGAVRTYDMGGEAGTMEMAAAVAATLRSL